MPSPLSRRLDKAEAAAGLSGPNPKGARHVVASARDFWPTVALFRSPFSLPPPDEHVPPANPQASVYERLTYGQARAAGIVYEAPGVRAEMEANRSHYFAPSPA
ncbi:MAG TPA: hypothetical protein VGB53_01640 [Rubricoccaceae bacterium]|jgi:hypothetical protein